MPTERQDRFNYCPVTIFMYWTGDNVLRHICGEELASMYVPGYFKLKITKDMKGLGLGDSLYEVRDILRRHDSRLIYEDMSEKSGALTFRRKLAGAKYCAEFVYKVTLKENVLKCQLVKYRCADRSWNASENFLEYAIN